MPDGAFYADAVEWAAANEITFGRTADLFDPDAGVTRGENVTFAHRYDTNVVQPALATKMDSAGVLWATMNSTGSITQSMGANLDPVQSKQLDTGEYEVDFTRDISSCAAIGAPADLTNSQIPIGADVVKTYLRGSDTSSVFVETRNSAGAFVESAFTVMVLC